MGANGSEFQSRLAHLREQVGLTQLELSRRVGVTETTIANWERGRSGMDWFERIMRLCEALNCQVQDLIEKQNSNAPDSNQAILQEEEKRSEAGMSLEDLHGLTEKAMPLQQLSDLANRWEQSEPSVPDGLEPYPEKQR